MIQNCTVDNIDSTGIIIEMGGDAWLGQSGIEGNNTFSNFQPKKWCIYNGDDGNISAIGNTWPASDSATIDTLYIYDDDEDTTSGHVIFVPFNP
jgi:hypothetical protein